MGFDWMKGFPGSNLAGYPPQMNILFRFSANASDLANVAAFGQDIYATALDNKDYIDAYEIGNEVNIDNPDYGWGASANAADYKTLLCEAYTQIKQADPTAIVVSAGLAPTGRVQGTWNGHPGHNGNFQDDREFLKELFNAGGGACLDAVGYHPYGFQRRLRCRARCGSRPIPRAICDPRASVSAARKRSTRSCSRRDSATKRCGPRNSAGSRGRPITCLSDPSWGGRQWQIVSDDKQASNLVGAYQYADAHWPWMGGMFVFNLDFNQNPALPECEQMRYYSIEGKPAESALAAMPKSKASLTGQLQTSPQALSDLDRRRRTAHHVDAERSVLVNAGWQSLSLHGHRRWQCQRRAGAKRRNHRHVERHPGISAAAERARFLAHAGHLHRDGHGELVCRRSRQQAAQSIDLQMIVVSDVQRVYLPLITR